MHFKSGFNKNLISFLLLALENMTIVGPAYYKTLPVVLATIKILQGKNAIETAEKYMHTDSDTGATKNLESKYERAWKLD